MSKKGDQIGTIIKFLKDNPNNTSLNPNVKTISNTKGFLNYGLSFHNQNTDERLVSCENSCYKEYLWKGDTKQRDTMNQIMPLIVIPQAFVYNIESRTFTMNPIYETLEIYPLALPPTWTQLSATEVIVPVPDTVTTVSSTDFESAIKSSDFNGVPAATQTIYFPGYAYGLEADVSLMDVRIATFYTMIRGLYYLSKSLYMGDRPPVSITGNENNLNITINGKVTIINLSDFITQLISSSRNEFNAKSCDPIDKFLIKMVCALQTLINNNSKNSAMDNIVQKCKLVLVCFFIVSTGKEYLDTAAFAIPVKTIYDINLINNYIFQKNDSNASQCYPLLNSSIQQTIMDTDSSIGSWIRNCCPLRLILETADGAAASSLARKNGTVYSNGTFYGSKIPFFIEPNLVIELTQYIYNNVIFNEQSGWMFAAGSDTYFYSNDKFNVITTLMGFSEGDSELTNLIQSIKLVNACCSELLVPGSAIGFLDSTVSRLLSTNFEKNQQSAESQRTNPYEVPGYKVFFDEQIESSAFCRDAPRNNNNYIIKLFTGLLIQNPLLIEYLSRYYALYGTKYTLASETQYNVAATISFLYNLYDNKFSPNELYPCFLDSICHDNKTCDIYRMLKLYDILQKALPCDPNLTCFSELFVFLSSSLKTFKDKDIENLDCLNDLLIELGKALNKSRRQSGGSGNTKRKKGEEAGGAAVTEDRTKRTTRNSPTSSSQSISTPPVNIINTIFKNFGVTKFDVIEKILMDDVSTKCCYVFHTSAKSQNQEFLIIKMNWTEKRENIINKYYQQYVRNKFAKLNENIARITQRGPDIFSLAGEALPSAEVEQAKVEQEVTAFLSTILIASDPCDSSERTSVVGGGGGLISTPRTRATKEILGEIVPNILVNQTNLKTNTVYVTDLITRYTPTTVNILGNVDIFSIIAVYPDLMESLKQASPLAYQQLAKQLRESYAPPSEICRTQFWYSAVKDVDAASYRYNPRHISLPGSASMNLPLPTTKEASIYFGSNYNLGFGPAVNILTVLPSDDGEEETTEVGGAAVGSSVTVSITNKKITEEIRLFDRLFTLGPERDAAVIDRYRKFVDLYRYFGETLDGHEKIDLYMVLYPLKILKCYPSLVSLLDGIYVPFIGRIVPGLIKQDDIDKLKAFLISIENKPLSDGRFLNDQTNILFEALLNYGVTDILSNQLRAWDLPSPLVKKPTIRNRVDEILFYWMRFLRNIVEILIEFKISPEMLKQIINLLFLMMSLILSNMYKTMDLPPKIVEQIYSTYTFITGSESMARDEYTQRFDKYKLGVNEAVNELIAGIPKTTPEIIKDMGGSSSAGGASSSSSGWVGKGGTFHVIPSDIPADIQYEIPYDSKKRGRDEDSNEIFRKAQSPRTPTSPGSPSVVEDLNGNIPAQYDSSYYPYHEYSFSGKKDSKLGIPEVVPDDLSDYLASGKRGSDGATKQELPFPVRTSEPYFSSFYGISSSQRPAETASKLGGVPSRESQAEYNIHEVSGIIERLQARRTNQDMNEFIEGMGPIITDILINDVRIANKFSIPISFLVSNNYKLSIKDGSFYFISPGDESIYPEEEYDMGEGEEKDDMEEEAEEGEEKDDMDEDAEEEDDMGESEGHYWDDYEPIGGAAGGHTISPLTLDSIVDRNLDEAGQIILPITAPQESSSTAEEERYMQDASTDVITEKPESGSNMGGGMSSKLTKKHYKNKNGKSSRGKKPGSNKNKSTTKKRKRTIRKNH
jgi:hypothetical protein